MTKKTIAEALFLASAVACIPPAPIAYVAYSAADRVGTERATRYAELAIVPLFIPAAVLLVASIAVSRSGNKNDEEND